ncbi:PREDICTED: fibroblast growth factor receptor 4-like [Amphimedon queenslandica]|uniref:receptor protein-tyrosine kinase n=1 Tax=Amphimedon queenslandica TaxID=400682 RepID=A0A1X7V391_AMPQE|nr:PREDICTED: fibroblast growth factor receptor 4-like [Amphimedon queenslandica]|eukprot:XP_019850846.1 PREDICTED: fibroblast growth factor receptor 4-like [Amphimedon queenslandica]
MAASLLLLIILLSRSAGMAGACNETSETGELEIIEGPVLVYANFATFYIKCSVCGEPPFEMSWIYSPQNDSLSNHTILKSTFIDSNSSNSMWKFRLQVNLTDTSATGYYYCRANSSFSYIHSSAYYVKKSYKPRIKSANVTRFNDTVKFDLEVNGYPLPKFVLLYQYLTVTVRNHSKVIIRRFKTAGLRFSKYYLNDASSLSVIRTSDDSAIINWTHPYGSLFSMQLVVAYLNSQLKINYTKIYAHSGHPYLQISSAVHILKRATLTCFCAECTDIKWWRDGSLLSENDYEVKSATRKLGKGISIKMKYSSYAIAVGDRSLYTCSLTDTYQSNRTFQNFAHIERMYSSIALYPREIATVAGENASISCNAKSVHKISAKWIQLPEPWFNDSGLFRTQSSRGDVFNVLNSTISFPITAEAPFSFRIRCQVQSVFTVQEFDFTRTLWLLSNGLFFKRLKFYYTTAQQATSLTVKYPSSVRTNTTEVTVNETGKITLWCFATGNPQPTIYWYYNNKTLHSNDHHVTIAHRLAHQSVLIISPSNRIRDEGVYTCEAINNVANLINARQTCHMKVNIQVSPKLDLPDRITAYKGDNANITVQIVGPNPPVSSDSIKWSYWNEASSNVSILDTNSNKMNTTKDSASLIITDVTSDDEGYYQVMVWHPAGITSKATYLSVETDEGEGEGQSYTVYWSTALALVVILVVILCILVATFKYSKKKRRSAAKSRFEMYNYYVRRRSSSTSNCETCLNVLGSETVKSIPPTFLLKKSHIKILGCIGQGEFAKVYKGHYYFNNQCTTVAVKTLKGTMDKYSQEDMKELIFESLVMQDLDHPNVMGLIGLCLDAGPSPLVVLPYMEGGNLLKHLVRNRESLLIDETTGEDEINQVRSQLLSISLQIGKGMQYIAEKKLIHRDLAARNCMIDGTGNIKVADFGLSKNIIGDNVYYRQEKANGVKLPIKWMAIESIEDGIFTEKTDIWSFGITVWEVFSGGKMPYGGFSPFTVKTMLADGHKLEAPLNLASNDDIYQKIMLPCWERNPTKRPTFAQIVVEIEVLLSNSVGYLDITL